jgi:hypothetical protein
MHWTVNQGMPWPPSIPLGYALGSTVVDLLIVAGGADAAGASPALLALRPAARVRVDSGAATATTSVRVVCVGARWGRRDLWGRRGTPGDCATI